MNVLCWHCCQSYFALYALMYRPHMSLPHCLSGCLNGRQLLDSAEACRNRIMTCQVATACRVCRCASQPIGSSRYHCRTWGTQHTNQPGPATLDSEADQTSPPVLRRAQPPPPANSQSPSLCQSSASRQPTSPQRYRRCQTRLRSPRPSVWTRKTGTSRAVMRLSTRTTFRSRCRYGSTPTAPNTLSRATL